MGGYNRTGTIRKARRDVERFEFEKGQPTVGFEPTTRCLQISRQLNSGPNFGFPCIPGMSIESKEFHSGGYNGGYSKSSQNPPPGTVYFAGTAVILRRLATSQK